MGVDLNKLSQHNVLYKIIFASFNGSAYVV